MTAFLCQHCGASFVRKTALDAHNCEAMDRVRAMDTFSGTVAYTLYDRYCTLQGRRPLSRSAFATSPNYTAFTKFADIVKSTQIDTDAFIKTMNHMGMLPKFWTRDDVFSYYVEQVTYKMPVHEAIAVTERTLLSMSREHDCNVADIFDHIDASDVVGLLRQGNITPWVLLNSFKFKDLFETKATEDDVTMLKSFIKNEYWRFRFINEPDNVAVAKEFVRKHGI